FCKFLKKLSDTFSIKKQLLDQFQNLITNAGNELCNEKTKYLSKGIINPKQDERYSLHYQFW
ncbi:hypothetical protein, partial [Vibrio parahaemolyticus]|uniref:hypothetical protein n=1 Tax=Vibrio parahaemolyticus TaxID=670 RepID=UPI00215C37F0